MLRDFIPSSNNPRQDKNPFYVKMLLEEKQKQLLGQLNQLTNPDKSQFILDKISTIQKLLKYQENISRTKNIFID